jgi:membrane protein
MSAASDRVVDLLRTTVIDWIEDDAGLLGAGLAYYGLLSLAPLLLLVLSVSGMYLGEATALHQVQVVLVDVFGPITAGAIGEMLTSMQHDESMTVTNTLGIAILVYASTRLFAQLQRALHMCWGISAAPGDFHHRVAQNILRRVAAFGVILVMAIVIIASVSVQSAIGRFGLFGTVPSEFVTLGNNAVLSICLVFGLIAVFKWLPCAYVKTVDVWPGALVTACLMLAGKFALSSYLVRFAAASAYGIAGTTLLVILFLAYTAQIFLLGAEFTKVWIDQFGQGMRPRRGWRRVVRTTRED